MDANHQATDLAVGVGPSRYLDPVWAGSHHACTAPRSTSATALSASPDVGGTPRATRPLFVHTLQRQPSCVASIRAWQVPRRATMNPDAIDRVNLPLPLQPPASAGRLWLVKGTDGPAWRLRWLGHRGAIRPSDRYSSRLLSGG